MTEGEAPAARAAQVSAQANAQAPLSDWLPLPWILAGLLALAGLLIYFLTDGHETRPLNAAITAFIFFGSICAAFSIGQDRVREPAIFAVLAGLVMAGLTYNAVVMQDHMAGAEFGFAAGVFASIIALPLFQAGFHRTRFATEYRITHFHVWTDAVSSAGALAFTGLSWIMLVLLNGLLDLVGIDLISTLMDKDWFALMWSGGAFGAALGVLRNNLKIIGSLQSVVLMVLSLLAVPLALALVVFLVALLASGGQALWDATDAATPVLLACALGSYVLANVIIRDEDEARSPNRIMRITSLVLAAGILPLAVFAAISMGIRIDQYGLAPERIWALVTIIIAVAYGLAYWVGLVRGRKARWTAFLRRANLHLAAATCVAALILALPILDFGGISARNQVARLEAGRVTPQEFDYAALRWDFGDAGREVLADLAAGEGEVAQLALAAQAQTERPYSPMRRASAEGFTGKLRVQSDDPTLRPIVLAFLQFEPWQCGEICVAVDLGMDDQGRRDVAFVQAHGYQRVLIDEEGNGRPFNEQSPDERQPLTLDSVIEVRDEVSRHIYLDGRRIGPPLVDAAVTEPAEVPLIAVPPAE
ncbi:hypothetical protein GCM10009127_27770 [Alteraurantiacibacter aestuarii]|uniref:DUF4153 domain-containing protein n=1 Tax=Alteraurantiacibacter aestuarii TaxID=650004 RepID=A0A844ZQ19_9SPHN|nr:DUF4153 domain-containing protein [Alteraurantiacibacter aestuarii]MXO88887.1 DUF4153 domain-containing protein [Alteraurantiacibacter aestuarii]